MVSTDGQPHAKNDFVGICMPQNVYFHQNLEIDFSDQCNTFSILRIVETVKIKVAYNVIFFMI